MPQPITVESLDRMRPNLRAVVAERARRLSGMRYCDLRIQVREERGAVAENGNEKASGADVAFGFGVRVIAQNRMTAAGYYGQILGAADADNIEAVVWEGIRQAYQRARANGRHKSEAKSRFPGVADSLDDTYLSRVPVAEDSIPATYAIDPRSVPLAEAVRMAVDGCKAAQGQSDRILNQYLPAPGTVYQLRRRRH